MAFKHHILAGWLVVEKNVTPARIRQGIDELGPCFYRFEFGAGLETTPAMPASVVDIFDTRLQMVNAAVDAHFGDRLRDIESVSYTHLRAHETGRNLVCRLLLEKKK